MKFKTLLAVGIVATIGAALWMREIASWRPQVVARLEMRPHWMELSRNGRRLLVTGLATKPTLAVKTVVVDLDRARTGVETGAGVSSDPQQLRDFETKNAANFPNIGLDQSRTQLVFWTAPDHNVPLANKSLRYPCKFQPFLLGANQFAWSKTRREVYHENFGELLTWNWNTGQLKKRFRYHEPGGFEDVVFSPDDLSLLVLDQLPQGVFSLRRFDVPTGKETRVIYRVGRHSDDTRVGDFGWSPDGKAVWFTRRNSEFDYFDFNVVRAADSKLLWSAPCAGPSKWLPDGRIGFAQRDGFSFRNASGREVGRASGPLRDTDDWQASPDGRWIYDSSDSNGTIRRWRAK